MTRAGRPLLVAAVLVTLVVGVALRWTLAGVPGLPGGFVRWRQVHSHLGYYGVLFPLLWGAWRQAGARVPGPRVAAAYAAAVLLATAGFLRVGGYGPEAMAGSTLVLAVWLRDAWRNRRRALDGADWLGTVPVILPVAAACIPGVAVLQGRDPAMARQVLQAFLSLLLLGVLVPGALRAVRAPAVSPRAWTVAALVAAAWLGPLPGPVTALGVLALAGLLGATAWRLPGPLDRRLGWGAVAVGLGALGAGLLPDTHPVAVGAIHFLVLGPLLDALTDRSWPASAAQRGVSLAGAAGMAGALVLQGLGGGVWTADAAAICGTVAAVGWAWRLLLPARAPAPAPTPDPAASPAGP